MPRRPLGHLRKLPRNSAAAHFLNAAEQNADAGDLAALAKHRSRGFPSISRFNPGAIGAFLWNYARHVITPRPEFPAPTAESTVKVNDALRIAIAGDWATGTDESAAIASRIADQAADYTIHLGDVYYVGDGRSIDENCRNKRQNNGYDPVLWPTGKLGSFAMNGNHEAYARDKHYFEWIRSDLRQPSSCFCLYNRFWCVLGLDTGYNSEGMPFLGWLAERYGWKWLMPSCALPSEVVDWLETKINAEILKDQAILLLTHHQYVSSFENEYSRPAEQLAQFPAFRNRNLLWFWGHEHRLAGYGLCGDSGIRAYGRCLGNGGMPVERGVAPKPRRPIQFYDDRSYDPESGKIVAEATDYGVNGYALLAFDGASLRIEYRDLNDSVIVSELWRSEGGSAILNSQTCDSSIRGTT